MLVFDTSVLVLVLIPFVLADCRETDDEFIHGNKAGVLHGV